ncbi:calcyclin-binding protein-like [Panonychus citri]|uniref:calcyclin-binding protein-like n=1 Tax=Panonychus citri TaxID=50023 RepID=UPI002307A9AB|nr:calcyclin-binding protein-like [Panonychus citri]
MDPKELENVELDYIEVKSILDNHVTRESTRKLLINELSRLENLKKSLASKEVKKISVPTLSETELTSVTNFAWDQSDKFIKIYLSLDTIKEPFEDEQIKLTFADENSVKVIFGRYKFTLTKLSDKLNTQESYFKRTKSKIILYLKKKKEGNWSNIQYSKPVTVVDEKERPDDNADPSATLMSLMKKMYQEGDDEMKRTIAKSWYEAQQKKESDIDLP